MASPVFMPKPGQMTEECTIVAWHKEEGEPVHRGDVLFEIETDKANMDVESFEDGVLLKRIVAAGTTVPVNTICAWVGTSGEVIPEAPAAAESGTPAAGAKSSGLAAGVPAVAGVTSGRAAEGVPARAPIAPPLQGAADDGSAALRISPRASSLAAEAGIDPRAVAGTGPAGRIVERDIRAAIAGGTVVASTAAGSGPAPVPASAALAQPPAAQVEGEGEPRPMSRMRRVIAERLTRSWQTTPCFTVTVAVDVTRLLALRAELRAAAGTNLTVTDFVLAATAQSLAEFPDVNSRTDGVSVWPRRRVHLGIAVSVPAGLVVPVVRDADRLSLIQIHDRAAQLAAAAREGRLGVDDMSGGTFTVSNLGMFGVEEFSAIINPGEAAILAVSSAIATPVAVGESLADGLVVRSIMRLTLSADHRIVDGEMGARFVNAIRRRLEDAASFRQEIVNG